MFKSSLKNEQTAIIGSASIRTIPITTPPTVFNTFGFVNRATAIFFKAAPTVTDIISPRLLAKKSRHFCQLLKL